MVDPARRIGRPPASCAQRLFQLGLARRLRGFVLEVAGDGDAAGVDPQRGQAVAVLGALDTESADGGKQGAEQGAQAAHPPEAPVSHPAVDHGNRDSPAAGFPEEERPVIPLHQHQGPRLMALEEPADGEAQVEGKVGHLGAVLQELSWPVPGPWG